MSFIQTARDLYQQIKLRRKFSYKYVRVYVCVRVIRELRAHIQIYLPYFRKVRVFEYVSNGDTNKIGSKRRSNNAK
jgi:hypothetical protein